MCQAMLSSEDRRSGHQWQRRMHSWRAFHCTGRAMERDMATETALRGLQRGEWTSQSRRDDHYSFCLKFVSQGLQAHSRASSHDVWLLRLAVACLSQTHEACES